MVKKEAIYGYGPESFLLEQRQAVQSKSLSLKDGVMGSLTTNATGEVELSLTLWENAVIVAEESVSFRAIERDDIDGVPVLGQGSMDEVLSLLFRSSCVVEAILAIMISNEHRAKISMEEAGGGKEIGFEISIAGINFRAWEKKEKFVEFLK